MKSTLLPAKIDVDAKMGESKIELKDMVLDILRDPSLKMTSYEISDKYGAGVQIQASLGAGDRRIFVVVSGGQ